MRNIHFLVRVTVAIALIALSVDSTESFGEEELPPFIQTFLENNCIDCHSSGSPEGDLDLEIESISWTDRHRVETWELIHTMVSKEIMPPPDASQPSKKKRQGFLNWLDKNLKKQSPIGGTTLRRLSRREYEKTIQKVFGLPKFKLPDSFPPDNELHGFNNQGDALVVAASHLEAFSETAAMVADEFFAPPRKPITAAEFDIAGKDLVISYSSACLIDGEMRLGSSGSGVVRNATWPMRFAAPASGQYKIEIIASANGQPSKTPILDASTMALDAGDVAKGKTFEVKPGAPQTLTFDLDLDRGRTIVLRYPNGPFNYEDKAALATFLQSLFIEDPRLAAAWKELGQVPRGGSGWARLKKTMADPDLEIVQYEQGDKDLVALAKRLGQKAVNTGETLVYKYFEEGPNIGIHQIKITGPHKLYPDPDDVRIARQRTTLMGKLEGKSDPASLKEFLAPLLTKLFRRPATDAEVTAYTNLVAQEFERRTASGQSNGLNDSLHLALRTALISPAFLYRSIGPGELNDYELASRLSYFLTSGPPTEKLQRIAASGRLSKSEVLLKEADRLINDEFAQDFTTQWLGLAKLDNLMPDARLIKKFTTNHRDIMRDEVKLTFKHILDNNLPVNEFISPDFVFTDAAVGWEIYGFEQFKPVKKNQKKKGKTAKVKKGMQKVEVARNGKVGGLLSMPAVMMATANGVDTQPVLRGVWMLENVLGSPPPEPPNAVPALTPDTSGANSPKDRLAAHMNSEACAVCHRDIDPLGFVLENYDPIGRWRDHYPKYVDEGGNSKRTDGLPVDATGTLPTGEKLNDITDLKRILADEPEPFARCVSEKLMSYATGRKLNYRERAIIADIVEQQKENDLRFRDLLLALIDSEVFRTK